MPRDTTKTRHATPMVAARARTLTLGKALGAMCSIPGMRPRYAQCSRVRPCGNGFPQVLATRGDRRNLEEIRRNLEPKAEQPRYHRLAGDDSRINTRLETRMGSHHADRRQFLTESAALASLAVGAVQSVEAQAPPPEARLKDQLAYGQPSQFDTTVRRALGAGSAIADTALTT